MSYTAGRECGQRGCRRTTREGKPFCLDHLDRLPRVQAIMRRLEEEREAARRAQADREQAKAREQDPAVIAQRRAATRAKRAEAARRLNETRRSAAKQGRYQGGPAPYGYCRGGDGELELVPDQAAVVRRLFREAAKGAGPGKLADDLNARGVLTKGGDKWSRAAISYVLANKTYLGRIHYAGVDRPGSHPAIVTKATFERCKRSKNGRASA